MTATYAPGHHPPGHGDVGVESNARLTATTAAVLIVLLAAEGVTILRIRALLSPHIFIGMLLVPPVVVKLGSTSWRFVRYYRGMPAYRRKGPPHPILRLLGPLVVILTVVLFASGVTLVLVDAGWRDRVLLIHKVSFFGWLGVMTIHVLGHLRETARLAPLDWARRTRQDVEGAAARQWIVTASLVVGTLLALLLVSHTHYHPRPPRFGS